MKILTAMFLFIGMITQSTAQELDIGAKAPMAEVKMKCVTKQDVSLNDVMKDNGLVVIFSCNTCPYVLMWEDRYHSIAKVAAKSNVGMAVLNSNYAKRNGADSYEKMQEHAKKKGYTFPYLVDKDSKLANAFGAKTTPHVFLFDKEGKLVYKGAIDDHAQKATKVTKNYLRDAIVSVSKGEMIKMKETPPVGCSIKRKLNK
ncbi:thioredoxin family protein [Puteibacter caeruleilacunae]|nr:thioredoxin family protein [Puteibacter caeruleilacunae]